MDLLQPGTADVDPNSGLRELQQAMGATDEEMAMLEQLGEGSWPLEDADIMDLDNQKSAIVTPTVAPTSTGSTPTDTVSSSVAKLVEDTSGEGTRREEDGSALSSVTVVLCIQYCQLRSLVLLYVSIFQTVKKLQTTCIKEMWVIETRMGLQVT